MLYAASAVCMHACGRSCARARCGCAQWRTGNGVLEDSFQGASGAALRILGLLLAELENYHVEWQVGRDNTAHTQVMMKTTY